MSAPRRVVPGTTYHISRRCLDRRFYLVPSEVANQILLYAFAYAAHKHGVQFHGFVVQANHPHLVITDVRGVLPCFLRDLHRDIARALKVLHDIHENVWNHTQTSCVELTNEGAQQDAVVYAILNPVKAHLVFRAAEWPGLVSLPGQREFTATKPKGFFGPRRPEVLTLPISSPPGWTHTEEAWHERLDAMVSAGEAELAAERRREQRPVLGRERVMHQSPFDNPREVGDRAPKRNPVIASGGDPAALFDAIVDLRKWRAAYAEARRRWRDDKTTVFPHGTWWVVQHAGAVAA